MVRSPTSLYWSSSSLVNEVDLKVIFGYCAASKNSALFRWSSRMVWLVSTLSTSNEKLISAPEKSAFSVVSSPSKVLNEPVTVEITRCFTLNCTSECMGSSTHFVVSAAIIILLLIVFIGTNVDRYMFKHVFYFIYYNLLT